MAQKDSEMKDLKPAKRPSFASRIAFWTTVLGVNVYDLLGLCHLVPVHTLHINRPFMMSSAQFMQKRRKKVPTH